MNFLMCYAILDMTDFRTHVPKGYSAQVVGLKIGYKAHRGVCLNVFPYVHSQVVM